MYIQIIISIQKSKYHDLSFLPIRQKVLQEFYSTNIGWKYNTECRYI